MKPTKSMIAVAIAAATIGATPAAYADIELGSGLSVKGFADMSYYNYDEDGSSSVSSAGIDQFEMDFLYTGTAGISAEVDIEYGENFEGSGDTTFVEQAFVTKTFTEQFSMKVGRFLSYSGWEAEEPTGLYQYSSVGYAPFFYGYYQQGVSAAYSGEKFGFTASIVNSAFDPLARDSGKPGYELGASIMPVEGWTAKLFYIVNQYDGVSDDEVMSNSRIGATLAVPVTRQSSIKVYVSTGTSTRTGTNFDLIGIGWQYRW